MVDEETTYTPTPAEEPTATPPNSAEATMAKPEAAPAPTEPEAVQDVTEPAPSAQGFGGPTQTAQMGRSEPLAPEPPPSRDATAGQSEPIPLAPEPVSAPAQNSPPISATVQHLGRDVLVKARAMIQERKHKKLEKIMEALNTTDPTTLKLRRAGEITNDEVEKLLHVSDATATRYLSALEKDGKIKQVGKTGIAVVYTKV